MNATSEPPARTNPRILVVDLETTGLSADDCSILEIGAVWLCGGLEGHDEFSTGCRMWDGARVEPRALEINGCSESRCTNSSLQTESEAVDSFFTWLLCSMMNDVTPVMLAGLNPSFDRAFLRAAWRRAVSRCEFPFKHRVLDLHSLAVLHAFTRGEIVPSRGFYTDEIYALLGMEPEPRPHKAIVGARYEAHALRLLMPELLTDNREEFPCAQ